MKELIKRLLSRNAKRALAFVLMLCMMTSILPAGIAGTPSASASPLPSTGVQPPEIKFDSGRISGGGDEGRRGSLRPGEPRFAEDRVIVKLTGGLNTRSSIYEHDFDIAFTNIRLLNPSADMSDAAAMSAADIGDTQNNTFVLTLEKPGTDAVLNAIEALSAIPYVQYAEPDYLYELINAPNDPMYNTQYALERINAVQAWGITTGSKDIVVGVIDSGIEGTHPDLIDNLWTNPNPNQNGYVDDIHGYNFSEGIGGIPTDESGHGTHVAGTIGASGNNGIGITGVNWNVSLAWMGVSAGGNAISSSAAIEALNYANLHDIPITNNSWGGGAYSEALYEAIRDYKGLFVVAAGNNESDNDSYMFYPASYELPNILSVASTDMNDKLSGFSNYGMSSVHVAAPGSDVLSTYLNGGYEEQDGTSMASPHVAGIAALILAENPAWNAQQVKAAITGTTRQVPGLPVKNGGITDAFAALQVSVFHTVTFDMNYGTTAPVTELVADGYRTFPLSPDRERYILSGWSLAQSGGAVYDFTTPVTGSITLFAQWVQAEPGTFIAEFPNAAFRRAVMSILNQDGVYRPPEGMISAGDFQTLAAITGLDVFGMNITSLEGIKYFTSLEWLDAGRNQLTSADLEFNEELTNLRLDNNLITDIGLSNNAELIFLTIHNNQLTSIDLTYNTNLSMLVIDENQLTSIDLSNNSMLWELWIENNQLTGIDLSGNAELSVFAAEHNRLETVNITQNTKLTRLSLSNNQLTNIDLSKNENLTEAYLGFNQLTGIDVTGIDSLFYLDVRNNDIPSPDSVIGWEDHFTHAGFWNDQFIFYPQNQTPAPTGEVRDWHELNAAIHYDGDDAPSVITLMNDIAVPSEIMFAVIRDITLTGNHSITFAGDSYPYHGYLYTHFIVSDGATFVLDGPVIIQNTETEITGVKIDTMGTFIMLSGALTGSNSSGVEINSGTFIMENGTISGIYYNGAVANGDGFELSGGMIKNNTGLYAVGNWGMFNMTGGEISGQSTDPGQSTAAGVFNRGQFTMSDGAITDNEGRGVDNHGVFDLIGGSITDNTIPGGVNHPDFWGGGVRNSGTFTMTGGFIQDNRALAGGGVFNSQLGSFTISGGEINGNIVEDLRNMGIFDHIGGTIGNIHTPDTVRVTFAPNGGYAQFGGEFTIFNFSALYIVGQPAGYLEIPEVRRNGYYFEGWFDDADNQLESDTIVTADMDSKIYTARWRDLQSIGDLTVSGSIRSYNPGNPTTITLTHDSDGFQYTATIAATAGNGQLTQGFEITGVVAGTYTMVVTKAVHTTFTIRNIIVSDDVRLNEHPRNEIQVITLLCGDINGDGEIGPADLNILRSSNNYMRRTIEAINPAADLNGDGEIGPADLNILRSSINYMRGAVVVYFD